MKDWLPLFETCGAMVTNSHLVYTSGRHGSAYVNKDALYPRTEIISRLCLAIAEEFQKEKIEVVLAPALGGIVLSQWTAHHLSNLTGKPVLSIFAEKSGDSFIIKRGYDSLLSEKNTLLLEDILTTGGSIKKVASLAKELQGKVIAVAALCNRGGVTANELGVPRLYSLAELSLESWPAEDCPLCKKGVPLNTQLGKAKK